MKRNFRYITKFEEETRSAMQTRAIGTIDGILNASKLLLTASKKLLQYCDKENNPFVEKLTQFIQSLSAHIQMASRVEKLGLVQLSLQYGVDSDNIVTLVGQFYFVDYRKQGVDQTKFQGLMDDVVAKGNEVDSLANLADRTSSARLETRDWAKAGEMDEVGARELHLFADNESALQNQHKSIITNLARKYAKGLYDKDLAIKLWTYLADSASKLYSKEMGGEFTPATRRETARMMEELHFSSVQDEAIDYKKRSSSTELEKRGWFGGDDEDEEEEEKQPMSPDDAREEIRLIVMNTQGIYRMWMSMVKDTIKQWSRGNDKSDDAPSYSDLEGDFGDLITSAIDEMNKSIDEDSEDSEFPQGGLSNHDVQWVFDHMGGQDDLDEAWKAEVGDED